MAIETDEELDRLNKQIASLRRRLGDGETLTLKDAGSILGDYSTVMTGLHQRLLALTATPDQRLPATGEI